MGANDIFPLNPDYVLAMDQLSGTVTQTLADGSSLQYLQRPHRRFWRLEFRNRSTDELETFREWIQRFAATFFMFEHKIWVNNSGTFLQRRFPVQIVGDWQERLEGHERHSWEITFAELPGVALNTADYPDPSVGHPSSFIEENHPTQAFVKSGTWTEVLNANQHAGRSLQNSNTNTTDAFVFLYSGYGFRFWAERFTGGGIAQILLDGVLLGSIDFFSSSSLPSAPIFSKLDVPLGRHFVEIRATNTKNPSATGQVIRADAIEVMF